MLWYHTAAGELYRVLYWVDGEAAGGLYRFDGEAAGELYRVLYWFEGEAAEGGWLVSLVV